MTHNDHFHQFNIYFFFVVFTGTVMGAHFRAIRAVEYSPEVNGILTGSWDARAKLWDPRSPRCVGIYTQPDKVLVV